VKIIAPFDPTNTLVLPIDHKHALFLTPRPSKDSRLMLFRINENGEEAFRQMLTVNGLQHKQAERFLMGTESGIKRHIYVIENIGKLDEPAE